MNDKKPQTVDKLDQAKQQLNKCQNLIDEARNTVIDKAKFVRQQKAELAKLGDDLTELQSRLLELFNNDLPEAASLPTVSGRSRRARHPVPPTSLLAVYGKANVKRLAEDFSAAYAGRHIRWNGCNKGWPEAETRVSVLDVAKWLDAETDAAYELLSDREHVHQFAALADPHSQLAASIRSGHFDDVKKMRNNFFEQLHAHGESIRVLPRFHQPGPIFPTSAEETIPTPTPTLQSFDRQVLPENCVTCVPIEVKEEAATSVEALAWAIVVEAALLNDRLNQDVRKLARAKQVYDLQTERDYFFFLPDSVLNHGPGFVNLQEEFQMATAVFRRYVEARWPIHVFAVDPREQDQNIADISSRKRELQFALALGFATGKIGGNSLTQYSRILETEIQTIGLNRTIVGFGHGRDTFGWRFHPRVQPLDVPGTLGTIRETVMGTSRDYDLRHRQIEPGVRECVAIVLMPSFVPYADFDIRTNWFKLTNPKNSALTMKDTVKLSRAVTAMRNSRARCAQCQHLYREGELSRLFKRVDQLDRELPLQTQRSLVPYENTLGGFEMFNTGVTDLAPELVGFYGAPGINQEDSGCGCYQGCRLRRGTSVAEDAAGEINEKLEEIEDRINSIAEQTERTRAEPIPACEGRGTSLFLVGRNFSVHDTKVIAGGVCIPHVQLISRELMRVTIPHCVNTVSLCENGNNYEYVAVYVATPYGITNHLHVPVISPAASQEVQELVKKEVEAALQSIQCQPIPVVEPSPAEPADCGCEQTSMFPLQANVPQAHPIQQAQYLGQPLIDTSGLSSEFETRLKRIEDSLEEVREIVGNIATTTNPSEPAVNNNSSFMPTTGSSQMSIQVITPPHVQKQSHFEKLRAENYPLLNKVKIGTHEKWRNLRDKLPCY